jgi:hypothetical protein
MMPGQDVHSGSRSTSVPVRVIPLFAFLLAVQGVNFAFDWWRRYDFEGERRGIRATLGTLEAELRDDQFVLVQRELE